jgi:hypothetical protein
MAHLLKVFLISILTLAVSAFDVAASASQAFEDQVNVNGTTFRLQGVGHKKFLFAKAFTAGFYMCESGHVTAPLNTSFPKHLEVKYFVNIPSHKLSDFTIDRMEKNFNAKELSLLDNEISLMKDFFVDIQSGDLFSLTYIPDQGTVFSHNGSVTGIIPGEQFAEAIFSVWIGEKPFDQRLKNDILGRSKASTSLANAG